MNRREAIGRVGLILGGTVIGAEFFISGCKSTSKKVNELFDQDNVAFFNEVGETILPATNTPGAKAADVGNFMALMVQDCYKPEDQKIFVKGIADLDEASKKKFGKKFMEADAKQRTELLTSLDAEQKAYTKTKKPEDPNHYFRMMKELTLLGFFTSEVGATKALRYVAVPGRYDGCVPYKKGDKAWAT
ncbi:gluconate 2-dehydrogenase subunit 3 family protein [Mucilaginibacter pocheonensis]|uniref:Gluconate 2-dehydrogenase subunit 3 n=1 Tax=Mucilaginibacter pocheonensis TaxID=398050 RepID=A0ABU1TG02_9SPHI|nr:gluconate 2-dehydrogenase subunit 3 family protein [Mucilaginibacter pocheonensis]MDR6944364.1 hypothetical protein [Mucilaginibacter pocheonensis]